jgi:HSP20 family protein
VFGTRRIVGQQTKRNQLSGYMIQRRQLRSGCHTCTYKWSNVMTTSLPSRLSRGLSSWFGRDPFVDLRNEMDELMSRYAQDWNGGALAEMTLPSTDISETDEAIEVKMDIPGLTAKEIDIEVRGNTLQVSGGHKEEKEEKEEKGKTFHRIERRHGRLYRSMTLPAEVNENRVQAECHDGVLTITLPKTEQAKARKIAVKAK